MLCAQDADFSETPVLPATDATVHPATQDGAADVDMVATDGSKLTHCFAAKAAGLHSTVYISEG